MQNRTSLESVEAGWNTVWLPDAIDAPPCPLLQQKRNGSRPGDENLVSTGLGTREQRQSYQAGLKRGHSRDMS